MLSTLEGPVYIERVGLGDNKQVAQASRAIKRAVENTVRGLGFSLIEVLSPCPTIWKMTPVDAQHWVRDVIEKTYPLGVFCDRTKERLAGPNLRLEAAGPCIDSHPSRAWMGHPGHHLRVFRRFWVWRRRNCPRATRTP